MTAVFARVLVGVDGSRAGRDAAAQAARLVEPGGELELVSAAYLVEGRLQRWSASRMAALLQLEAGPAVAEAATLVGPRAATRLLEGPPLQALLDEAERYEATLIAVGSHDHTRLSETLIGGVAGPLLAAAPCSILVARRAGPPDTFPRSLVVGIDGSPGSLAALAAAEELSERFGAPLRVVLARHGDVDVVHAELRCPQVEIVDGAPVPALAHAAASTDLLVVGSRGLRGLGRLGSVSERIAHRARSSVLVVHAP